MRGGLFKLFIMPLSDLYGKHKGKLESTQHRTPSSSTDLSYVPDNECFELVWENGQIMMQGQSSRVRKSPVFTNFPSQTPKLRERDRMAKFGAMGSVTDDFPLPVPSGEMGLVQDDDMVRWLNYPIDDNDYCSELLPELSGVTVNELSSQNSFASIDKRNSYNQTIKDSHIFLEHGNGSKVSSCGVDDLTRSRSGQLFPWSSQNGQTSVPSLRSGLSGISSSNVGNTQDGVCGNSIQNQDSEGDFPIVKMQKKDLGLTNTNSGLVNFSHFSRPAALARANLQTIGVQRMGNENNKSTIIDSSSCSAKKIGFCNQSNMGPNKVESQSLVAKPLDDQSCPAEKSEAVCQENAVKDIESPNQATGASRTKGIRELDGERTLDPVVASSSACSGNSAEGASNDLTHTLKRKCRETDDSEYRSEDVEEEWVGGRKAASARVGPSCKRTRAAEVHNLSERRRRDRINEKMRALQELIPNCNKVDKASMLDEAIEYLKTLQLQVQIMAMGAGLYMPPMMVPPGMQNIHAAHMAHFSPMGVGMGMGMGMGMGYGMGMLDMNSGSSGRPMIQMPPIQGPHFPAPPILGPNSFQGMAGANNLRVFGHPHQGIPMSMPRPPLPPLSAGPPVQPVSAEIPILPSASSSKDLTQNTNSRMLHNADARSSINQTSNQVVIDSQD